MPKEKSIYTCNECGATSPKWLGRCPGCNAWNTLEEGGAPAASGNAKPHRFQSLAPRQPVATLAEIEASEVERTPTGIAELDRVLGGGIVDGAVILIGGDPGIGKSTLLLQCAEALAPRVKVLYVTGEESGAQVALRARRLGLEGRQVRVVAEIQLERIAQALEDEQPAFVVIDSIQTLYSDALTSAPGSVAQVRECAAQLTRVAKADGIVTFDEMQAFHQIFEVPEGDAQGPFPHDDRFIVVFTMDVTPKAGPMAGRWTWTCCAA